MCVSYSCAQCVLQVLVLDASCAEAIACLAAEHFYGDQPELAIRYYRRLLQARGCTRAVGRRAQTARDQAENGQQK